MLRFQFKNDSNIYDYQEALVTKHIPYINELYETFGEDMKEKPTLLTNIEKDMFDAILHNNYSLLCKNIPSSSEATEEEIKDVYKENAAKLMVATKIQSFLQITDDEKKKDLCKVLMPQLLQGRQFLDYNEATSKKLVLEYAELMTKMYPEQPTVVKP